MPTPVLESAAGQYQPGGRLELTGAAGSSAAAEGVVRGILQHELPGALSNVTILVVQPQNLLLNTSSPLTNGNPNLLGNLPARVDSFSLGESKWLPGEPLDLGAKTVVEPKDSTNWAQYFGAFLPKTNNMLPDDETRPLSPNEVANNLTALSLFPMLNPPTFSTGTALGNSEPLARRRATHGMDLGRWFTQPCVIIIAQLGDKDTAGTCPIPLSVDGNSRLEDRITGRTVIRWVYPLRDMPPTYPQAVPETTPSTDSPPIPGGA
jgi:hypothetical protein